VAFNNSILAGTTLVRNEIKSEGFVAGVTGWQISRDGDAEFNNLVSRGEFENIGIAETVTISEGAINIRTNDPIDDQRSELQSNVLSFISPDGNVFGHVGLDGNNGHLVIQGSNGIVFTSDTLPTVDPAVLIHPAGYIYRGTYEPFVYEDWEVPGGGFAFSNSFANLGGVWEPAAYKIFADGMVRMKGAISRAGVTPDNTQYFQLPIKFRPTLQRACAVASLASAGADEPSTRIFPNGACTLWGMSAGVVNSAFAVDGVQWSIV